MPIHEIKVFVARCDGCGVVERFERSIAPPRSPMGMLFAELPPEILLTTEDLPKGWYREESTGHAVLCQACFDKRGGDDATDQLDPVSGDGPSARER